MHIRVERDTLAQAVTWAARTLPSRPSMPVLSGVMLIADNDSLTLSSFDYEISARVQVMVDVIETGRVLVSGRLLADITKSLPAAPVVLKLEGNRVSILSVDVVHLRSQLFPLKIIHRYRTCRQQREMLTATSLLKR